jgi:hypothetical protein
VALTRGEPGREYVWRQAPQMRPRDPAAVATHRPVASRLALPRPWPSSRRGPASGRPLLTRGVVGSSGTTGARQPSIAAGYAVTPLERPRAPSRTRAWVNIAPAGIARQGLETLLNHGPDRRVASGNRIRKRTSPPSRSRETGTTRRSGRSSSATAGLSTGWPID